jgi:hypothetical protein
MPPAAFRPAHLLLPAALAVLAAFLFVREAMVQGKLLAPPLPDDVNYMVDAAGRLNAFYTNGTRALIAGYVENPPHSPFSSGLAFLSLLIFGAHEWAPYAASALVALLFFAIVAWILRAVPMWQRAAVMVMLFPLPIVAVSIREFRPDLAAALLIAAGTLLAVEGPILGPSRRRAALVGALFGAALLAKPSTFPVTIALFGLTISAAGMLDPSERSKLRRLHRTIFAGLAAAAALALVAVPHFLLAARRTFGYMHSNIFGDDRELWVVEGSRLFHLRYYIDGPAGQYQFGSAGWIILGFAALALLLSARLQDGAAHRRFLVLFLVSGASWSLATINSVKQEFFGLPFQVTALFAAIIGLGLLITSGQARWFPRIPWAAALLITLAAASVLSFRFTQIWAPADRPATGMHELRQFHDDLYAAVIAHSRGRPATVFVTFNGRINWKNLQFRAHQDRTPLTFRSLNRARTPDLYVAEYAGADLIIASDPDHPHLWQRIQGAAFHAEVLRALRDSPEFRHVEELSTPRHPQQFHIFRRIPPRPAPAPPAEPAP